MAVIIRNTFLHFNQDEHKDAEQQHGRSNSAPPMLRAQAKREKGDYDSAEDSTACETLAPDTSTIASDLDSEVDVMTPRSSCTEHEDMSPPMTSRGSDSGDEIQPRNSGLACTKITPAAAQEQLDQMSQTVMDIWAKLRTIESSLTINSEDAVDPIAATGLPAEAEKETAPSQMESAVKPTSTTASMPLPNEVQSILSSTRGILTRIPGVTGVEVNVGASGTLATITVCLCSSSSKPALVASVLSTSKSALLDLAANSQSTYVLGYEAQPFQDDANGKSFATVLASMPPAWECSACWNVYQKGKCTRRKTCRWQHPGKNDLKPLRVVVC